jgi:hypothetical protein
MSETGDYVNGTMDGRVRTVERRMATLSERVDGLKADITSLGVRLDALHGTLRDREKEQSSERRALRLALIGLAATVLSAVILAAVTLAVAHP